MIGLFNFAQALRIEIRLRVKCRVGAESGSHYGWVLAVLGLAKELQRRNGNSELMSTGVSG